MAKKSTSGSWVTAPLKKEMLVSVNQAIDKSRDGAESIYPIVNSLIGVAKIGGMRGAVKFLELVLSSLKPNAISTDEYTKLIAPSLTIFSRYLDREISGEMVSSLILLKAYQAISASMQLNQIYEGVIFYPWKIVSIYDKSDLNKNKVSAEKFIEFSKIYSESYAKCLDKFADSAAIAMQEMRQALITLETKSPYSDLRVFFDSAICAIDSLMTVGATGDMAILNMIGQQLNAMSEGVKSAPDDVVSSLFFVIAKNNKKSTRSNLLRKSYHLDELINSVSKVKKGFSFNEKQRDYMIAVIKQLEIESELAATGNITGYIESIAKMAGLQSAPDPVVSMSGIALALASEALLKGANPTSVVLEAAVVLSILSDVVNGQVNDKQKVMVGRQRNLLLSLAGKEPIIDTSVLDGSALTEDFRQQLMIEVRAELNLVELVADNIVNNTLDDSQKSALVRSFTTVGGALMILGDKNASLLVKSLSSAIDDKSNSNRQKIVDGIGYLSSFVDAYRSGAKDAGNLVMKGLAIFETSESMTAIQSKQKATNVEAEFSNDEFMLEVFLEEAAEVVETLKAQLSLVDAQDNHAALTIIRRSYHTIKGSARMVGLDTLGLGAWHVEECLNLWLAKGFLADKALSTYLKSVSDMLEASITNLKLTKQVIVDIELIEHQSEGIMSLIKNSNKNTPIERVIFESPVVLSPILVKEITPKDDTLSFLDFNAGNPTEDEDDLLPTVKALSFETSDLAPSAPEEAVLVDISSNTSKIAVEPIDPLPPIKVDFPKLVLPDLEIPVFISPVEEKIALPVLTLSHDEVALDFPSLTEVPVKMIEAEVLPLPTLTPVSTPLLDVEKVVNIPLKENEPIVELFEQPAVKNVKLETALDYLSKFDQSIKKGIIEHNIVNKEPEIIPESAEEIEKRTALDREIAAKLAILRASKKPFVKQEPVEVVNKEAMIEQDEVKPKPAQEKPLNSYKKVPVKKGFIKKIILKIRRLFSKKIDKRS